jgi:uncharacterized protein involved in exopolysaccharide biosynthesis
VAEGLGSLSPELLDMNSSGNLFVGVLKSRTVQDAVIEKCGLRKAYGGRPTDSRMKLEENTEIATDRKSGIIAITVTDRHPERAAAIAREYVRELDSVITSLNTSAAHRERIFLEERLGQVKESMEASERSFSQFASTNKTPDVTEAGKALIESAAAIQGELIATQTELQSLKQVYADNNVRVRAAQARIAELERQMEKLGGTEPQAGGDDQGTYPSLRNLPLMGMNYSDLLRQTKIEQALFEALTQQYEIAKVEEAKEIPSVKVLDAADVPDRKIFPPRFLILALGTALAVGFASMAAIARERWQTTPRTTASGQLLQDALQEAEKWLGQVRGSYVSAARSRAPVSANRDHETPTNGTSHAGGANSIDRVPSLYE